MNKRCVALISGGLDSTLALKLILEQNVEVYGLKFFTPFCRCKFCITRFTGNLFNIPVKIIPLGEEYIETVVRNPKYGYGANLNACIDCRIFMFKKAKKYMDDINASFIVTGEVLDQRPMSQRKNQLMLIEKESGLEGLIVRPLCAKLLPQSIPEKEGIVDREKFLDIRGRSRRRQIDLIYEYGIFDYPTPAGGCLLTDPNFAKRMKDLLDHTPIDKKITVNDIELLKLGRHFRLNETTKFVVPRDSEENNKLKKIITAEDYIISFDPESFIGVYRGDFDVAAISTAASILLKYLGKKAGSFTAVVSNKSGGILSKVISKPLTGPEIDKYRIN